MTKHLLGVHVLQAQLLHLLVVDQTELRYEVTCEVAHILEVQATHIVLLAACRLHHRELWSLEVWTVLPLRYVGQDVLLDQEVLATLVIDVLLDR